MNKKGIYLVLSTAILSGVSIFLNKFALSVSNPAVLAFLKNATVALILISLIVGAKNFQQIKKIGLRGWLILVFIGLIGGSTAFILFFKGLALTSATQGSFIHKTMFIYVIILAAIFLKEKINRYFLAGAFLVLIGNFIALKFLSFEMGVGDLMILIATGLWAAENVISKYALREINSDVVAWGRMFFGSVFILGYLFSTGEAAQIISLSLAQAGWVAITGVLLFGYVVTWYRGLSKIPVTVAASLLLLGSPITSILTAIYAGKIMWLDALSIFSVILGVIIIFFGYAKFGKKEEIRWA
jgi:drug/metabolite transporter (DMT)-like permease